VIFGFSFSCLLLLAGARLGPKGRFFRAEESSPPQRKKSPGLKTGHLSFGVA
jgi:hypothetical protein